MANATVLDPSSPGGKQQQQQADALGISLQQYQALVAQYPPQYQANSQGGSYGMSAGGSYGQNPQLTDVLNGLAAQKQLGLGQQQQQAPASTSASGGPFTDAENLAGRMGAAAIGGKQIINPTPGMIPQGSKGGVAQVGSPMVSSDVPTMPGGTWSGVAGPTTTQGQAAAYNLYNQYAGNATSNPADIAKFYQGMTGQTVAQANAGAPPASGGTPTPTKPANAPGGAAATPWATAPPAPGASVQPQGATDWGAVAAHTSAMEDAGKSIYAHLTGNDPANATHADIAGFHDVLQQHIGAVASQMGGAQSGSTPFGQAPPGASNFTAGITPGVAATGATPGAALGVTPPPSAPGAPPRMATGGFVPGRGNGDTVPALLTPGEYVIPKAQAAQIFGGRAPVKMASGGWVDDDDSTDPRIPTPPPKRPPSEIPRTMGASGTPAQQGAPSPGTPQQQQSSSGSDSGSGSDKASPTNHGYWSNMVQQAQSRAGSNAPSAISDTPSVAPSYDMPSDPDPDWQYTGQESAAGPTGAGGGAANSVAAGADVASSLISGLQEAWDKYAKSIKNWQMIAPDFGKGGTPSYQTTQLQQDQDV